jgi:hypothetical protein
VEDAVRRCLLRREDIGELRGERLGRLLFETFPDFLVEIVPEMIVQVDVEDSSGQKQPKDISLILNIY